MRLLGAVPFRLLKKGLMSISTDAFRGHGLSRFPRLAQSLLPLESPSPFPTAGYFQGTHR